MSLQVVNATGDVLDAKLPVLTTPAGVTDTTAVGAVRMFVENDPGTATGTADLSSPEADDDYRLRVAQESLLAQEFFTYAAQNTGRAAYATTTMTNAWGGGFMTTNSGSIVTTTTGTRFTTYSVFPIANAQQTYCEVFGLFTAALGITNTFINFGLCTLGAANPYAPTDGVYWEVNSAGLHGVRNFNGAVTTTPIPGFTWVINQVYKFTIAIGLTDIEFWIDDVLYLTIARDGGQSGPCLSGAQPFSVRHAIAGGAASGAMQFKVASYSVSSGGFQNLPDRQRGNANGGEVAYEGRSGGTLGSTSNITNSQAFTSAVLSNTAAIVTGLGGRFGITIGASANTDGIGWSYQNPANSTTFVGRPIVIRGVWIDAVVQTALGATALIVDWYLAYGHTAVSLATAEAVAAKAPRRVPLGMMAFPASAAAGVQGTRIFAKFSEPIVVQPGEFVALVAQQPLGVTGTIFVMSGVDAGLL